MKYKDSKEFAEARELALLDYINGNLPEDLGLKKYDAHVFLDRINYTRMVAVSDGQTRVKPFIVPDWQSDEIQDALRIDGCNDFLFTQIDEHFVHETWRVWFDGVKRHYKDVGHGSSINITLLPAGTVMIDD